MQVVRKRGAIGLDFCLVACQSFGSNCLDMTCAIDGELGIRRYDRFGKMGICNKRRKDVFVFGPRDITRLVGYCYD